VSALFCLCFIHTNTQTVQYHIHCFIILFKVVFASLTGIEMRVTQIFMLFFLNSFFFVILILEGLCSSGTETRHVNLRVAYGPYRVTRSDTGQHDLKHLRKEIVERMIRVMGRSGPRAVSLSSCFRGGMWGVKYFWNRCSSILACETSS
jgi:hypothetical protein